MAYYPEEEFFLDQTAKEVAQNIAPCGYVCGMCYDTISRTCKGCQNQDEPCPIRLCCKSRSIRGCWECDIFPCCECEFRSLRIRAFLRCAKEDGIEALAGYLLRNVQKGVHYHHGKTYSGDYDACKKEEEILRLLRTGIGE